MGGMDASPVQTAALHPKSLHSQLRYKRLEHGVFLWPSNVEPGGTLMLTSAQLSMLIARDDHQQIGEIVRHATGRRAYGAMALFKITVNVQNVISFDTCGISKTISRVEYVRNGRPPSEADIDAEPVEAYP